MRHQLPDKYLELKTDFERLQWLEEECGVEIVSYGLAPNPVGYCYEIEVEERWENTRQELKDELDQMCNWTEEGYLSQ